MILPIFIHQNAGAVAKTSCRIRIIRKRVFATAPTFFRHTKLPEAACFLANLVR